MPSSFREPKNLPEWIELDYYNRPRKLRRWRRWFCLAAFLLCIGGVVAAVLTPQARKMYQAGPVTPAHAMFNADCGACHREKFGAAERFIKWDNNIRSVTDHACMQCHDGPKHNERLLEEIRCAECHREHQGRAMLARVPCSQCLRCHENLSEHRKGGVQGSFQNVTGFPDGHPEFNLWVKNISDPGKLRFNHKKHLQADGVLMVDGKKKVLKCIDCHQWDTAGKYIQPINYENHCASCHPLSVQLAGDFPEKIKEKVIAFNQVPAPHVEPQLVRGALRERLLKFVQEHELVGEPKVNLREKPKPSGDRIASELQWDWAKNRLSEIEARLFTEKQLDNTKDVLFKAGGGCRFCHVQKKRDLAGVGDPGPMPTFEKTNLPGKWFTHARFGHQSHRMLNCTECHKAGVSEKTTDVLMPKMETCAKCHNSSVGARNDCVECHGYHDRDLHHEIHKNRTIEECLRK